jgi:hypothetical protein
MLFAWVSHQNCSNILNSIIEHGGHGYEEMLSSEDVFCAFATLLYYVRQQRKGFAWFSQMMKKMKKMELRNWKMIMHGQRERMHACNKCEWLLSGTCYNNLCKCTFTLQY